MTTTNTIHEVAEAMTREHLEFDMDGNAIWLYTFIKTEAEIAKEIVEDLGFTFKQYLPIDKKNDKAGEYIIQ